MMLIKFTDKNIKVNVLFHLTTIVIVKQTGSKLETARYCRGDSK